MEKPKIINKSNYDTELLKQIFEFINQDLNVMRDIKEIEFKNCKTLFKGYYRHGKKTRKIMVAVNTNPYRYPYKIEYNRKTKNLNHYNGYLNYLLLNHYETLVHVLAHELRHVWQHKNQKNRDKWIYNSYGKFSNKDADSFAIRKQREFRRKTQDILIGKVLNIP